MQGNKTETINIIEQIGIKQTDGSFLLVDGMPKICFAEVEEISGIKALKYGFSDLSKFFRVIVNVPIDSRSKLIIRGLTCVISDSRRLKGVVKQFELIATLSELR